MNKPLKKDFGYRRGYGWESREKEDEYIEALHAWENRPRNAGRQRTREVHPSWLLYLEKFQPIPGKSQGAFCDWANINRATFSAWQCKAIPMHIVELIGMWEAQGKEVENGKAK